MRDKQKGKQESINESDHEHELEAIVPEPETWAFHSKLGFGEAESGLDLPATSVGEDNPPGIIDGKDRLIGQ